VENKDHFNHETERIVLSIIIREFSRINSLLEAISYPMFASAIHQEIWKNLVSVLETGMEPRPEVFIQFLTSKDQLEVCGGESYILMLAGRNDKAEDIDFFIGNLTDAYKVRVLSIMASSEIPAGIATTGDISALVSRIRDTLEKLETSGVGRTVVRIGDILKDVYDDIWERVANPGLAGIDTGFESVNALTSGYMPGDIWIIGARPSMGKSTFLITTLLSLAKRGIPTLMISREMGAEVMVERILSAETGIKFSDIRFGTVKEKDKFILKEKFEEIKKIPLFMDTNFYGDINYVSGIIRKFVRLNGVKVVAIDYIQLLVERDKDQTAELGKVSRALKLLAEDLKITILVASQLNRLLEMREDKRPILSDLRQSGNLEEDADVVFGMFREYMYVTDPTLIDRLEFNCLKQRNGRIGLLKLKFNGDIISITDPKNSSNYLGGLSNAKQAKKEGDQLGEPSERLVE